MTGLCTLQVLARGEALMRGKHGSFLHGHPASHTDQARLKIYKRAEERENRGNVWRKEKVEDVTKRTGQIQKG